MVRDIHNKIEGNFMLIQHTINALIGLITIVLSLLVGLVMGILTAFLRMARKVKRMRDNLTILRLGQLRGLHSGKVINIFTPKVMECQSFRSC